MNNPAVKKTKITVRIPDHFVNQLDIQCRRLKRSRSQLITDRLSEWLISLELMSFDGRYRQKTMADKGTLSDISSGGTERNS